MNKEQGKSVLRTLINYLRLLKEPEQCAGDDYCVEMLSLIDQKRPVKGWLDWE